MFAALAILMRRSALVAVSAITAGCAVLAAYPHPTEADFRTIQPGMTQEQVLAKFGRPTWVFGVRQENLSIWNYRYDRNDCVIYQVSMRPDGTVRDAAQGTDPGCDGGRERS